MNESFVRPNRPLEITPSTFQSFSLKEIAHQLIEEEVTQKSGKNALTLVRSKDLTLVLTVIKKGGRINEHHAPGPATIISLFGEVQISVSGKEDNAVLKDGKAVAFSADVIHHVEANEDSAFLIVIGNKR